MAQGIPSHKVILVGEYGAGKSSIFRRFLDNSFTTDTGPRSTIGLDHLGKVFTVNDTSIKLELWDTAGIERFATLAASYFQGASAAILCYAIDNRETFNILSHHILEIIMHSETAQIFLCGTKLDLYDIQVTSKDTEDFEIQCDAVLSGTYRISCKTNEGVREMFQDIAEKLMLQSQEREACTTIRPQAMSPSQPASSQKCCSK